MQTVWNRVAQTRATCTAPSQTVKSCVARQTATATGKRPTKFLTSATLLYSGIFAVAASTDALVKEKRRKQWDEAIASAKQGIDKFDSRIPNGQEGNVGDLVALDGLLDLADAEYETLEALDGAAAVPGNTGRAFHQSAYAPQSVYASRGWQENNRQRRLSPKKVQLTELSMDKMTLRILMQLQPDELRGLAMDGFAGTLQQLLGRPRTDLESLLVWLESNICATKSLPRDAELCQLAPYRGLLSRYSGEITQQTLHNASLLESNVARMFQKFRNGKTSRPQLILDMLHNITMSPSLPSLQTFNTILDGLSTSNISSKMTEVVIRAMRLCHVRMNEETVITILNHFRCTDNHREFCRYVRLIQGEDGGLWKARDDIWITPASQGRLVRQTRFGKEKIIQRMTPTPGVFQALIEGIVHFDGLEAALHTCRDMSGAGWGLSMRGLTTLLRECAFVSNWEIGSSVWNQIKLVQARSRQDGRGEKIQAGTYAAMMKLCISCNQPQQYEAVCKEAVASKNSTTGLLQQMQRLAEAEARMKELRAQVSQLETTAAPGNMEEAEQMMVGPQELDFDFDFDGVSLVDSPPLVKAVIVRMVPSRTDSVASDPQSAEQLRSKAEQTSHLHGNVLPNMPVPNSGSADLPAMVVATASQDNHAVSAQSHNTERINTTQPSMHGPQNRLHRDQLLGLSTSSAELDIYELTERPMNMIAWGEESAYC
ncbi:Hypothetical protein D9617_23g005570 [Elsinoe fawcettii]|nr:Hypothetical protein D9617_23g005570 [Elsinoe fawcettii]